MDSHHVPEAPAPSSPPPARAEAREARPLPPGMTVCDLAEAEAFNGAFKPHAPVLAAFGGNGMHQFVRDGCWDLERAVADGPPEVLFRSVRRFDAEKPLPRWDDLTFRHGPRTFLFADDHRVIGYAETPREAERLVMEFSQRYARAPVQEAGCFHLIRTGENIKTEKVPLAAETLLDPEVFALHYGGDGWTWHQDFAEKLRGSRHGLCIFEGSPGTGKTSYLRHLMGVLRETHRFYFIPPATLAVLSSPDFIGFWAVQRYLHDKHQFVVILEDADAALMTRGNDNLGQVSAILNLSDGMLADFLRLQIICTINCRAADIDPALLRPGRLLSHRVFERMDAERAVRLAGRLGRRLLAGGGAGDDYSLAEVYAGENGPDTAYARRPRLGFAA